MTFVYFASAVAAYAVLSHIISYRLLKTKIVCSRKWDLNICCGKTDGGGVNADIVKHRDLPNYSCIAALGTPGIQCPISGCHDWKSGITVVCSETIKRIF